MATVELTDSDTGTGADAVTEGPGRNFIQGDSGVAVDAAVLDIVTSGQVTGGTGSGRPHLPTRTSATSTWVTRTVEAP